MDSAAPGPKHRKDRKMLDHTDARKILDQQSHKVAEELIRLAEDFEEVLKALEDAQDEIEFWRQQACYWIKRARE